MIMFSFFIRKVARISLAVFPYFSLLLCIGTNTYLSVGYFSDLLLFLHFASFSVMTRRSILITLRADLLLLCRADPIFFFGEIFLLQLR